ncbi:MAG TPA: sugar phosphate isomerase/epimerase [Candidatus Atribacteria bacterium]|nr:sugar phosphate isomerase/epimerase [Candidatus Atribacteria bacterium]HPT79245.1 sugar phosphate isomerase/epimerase [Candidatus Atribacteria bacterium]
MIKLSFNSANFVARTSGYRIFSENWADGDKATNEYFRPLDTFGDRFDELVSTIKNLGFDYMDLWTAHLNWAWATDEHIEIANEVLDWYGIEILSYVGEFGSTEEEFTKACRLVKALGFDLMGGGSSFFLNNKKRAVEILEKEGVRFAFENHPNEKTALDVEAIIAGTPLEYVGVTLDTGWFMTNGYPPDKAAELLADRVMHVHLKDIKAPGRHDTCAYTKGCVPLYRCVRLLEESGYTGSYSIEHEPFTFDPSKDCAESKAILEKWLEEFYR